MATQLKLVEEAVSIINKLTVTELIEVKESLENAWGVKAATAQAFHGEVASAAAPVAEQKTSFEVILKSVGDKKLEIIKLVRAQTNLGLKEAKDLVETANSVIAENVSKEESEKIKASFEAAGASIEIK